MKQAYADVVLRFLADQGGQFRFYRARWWHLDDGFWVRDARLKLERELHNYMIGYFPVQLGRMNRSDMNQMCAFLSQRLEASGLPGRHVDAVADDHLLRPWVEPYVTESQ